MIVWSKLHRIFLYIFFYTKKLFKLSKKNDFKNYIFIPVTDDVSCKKITLKPLPKIKNTNPQESSLKKYVES